METKERKERRKGEGKRGNEGGRGGKGGERGNGTGKVGGAIEAKTRAKKTQKKHKGNGSPRTEIGRAERTTSIHRNKAVLNRHRAHKPGHSPPRKPPTLQHHGCPADKGGFSWAAYGNDDTGRTRQVRHGKSEYPYLPDKEP